MREKILRLLKESLQIYAAQVVGVLVSFGLSIVVARLLGADGRGAYGWIMALHFLAIQFAQVGADTMNRRVGAAHRELVPVLAGNSAVQALGLGFISATVFYGFGWLQPVGSIYPNALFLGLFAVPFAVLFSMWTSLATALGRTGVLAIGEMVLRFGQVLIVGLLVLTVTLRVGHLTLAFCMALMLATGYVGWRMHRLIDGQWRVSGALWWREKHVIVTAFLAGLCWQGLQRVDLLLLGAWRSLAEVGYYAVAQSLMDASLILPVAIGFVLTARSAEETERASRMKLLLFSMAGVGVVFGLICLAAAVLAPWFIPLLYGADFKPVVPVFQGLMIAAVIVALYQVAQGAVYGYARARYLFLAPLAGLGVKVLAAVWLIPAQGLAGAVTSSQLGFTAALVTALAIAWQRKEKHA